MLGPEARNQQKQDLEAVKENIATLDRASALFTKETADPEEAQANKTECKKLLDQLMTDLAHNERAMLNRDVLAVLKKFGINIDEYKKLEATPAKEESGGF